MRRLLALVVLLAACAAPTDDAAGPATAATDAPSAPVSHETPDRSVAAVPAALDWTVDRLGGGQIAGGDLAGRDVVLWFWAPW